MKSGRTFFQEKTNLQDHINGVKERYRKLYESPENCEPVFIIETPVEFPSWEEMLESPELMLDAQLKALEPHFEIQDDHAPCVRVNFGTAQPASAYGCDIYIPPNSLPAAENHILDDIEKAFDLEVPDINAGWYGKLHEWTDIWLERLPEGIEIQHPDIQSTFNTAHLVRGNDIFLDFYDNPDALDALFANITEFMVKITRVLKSRISDDKEYFYDWSAMWKGSARISNCTMQLLSPELYRDFVMKYDQLFLNEIGGGRIHYCGDSREMANTFFSLEGVSGYDIMAPYDDAPFEVCNDIPSDRVPFIALGDRDSELCKKILNGERPEKRNIIFSASAPDIESGKALLEDLRSVYC